MRSYCITTLRKRRWQKIYFIIFYIWLRIFCVGTEDDKNKIEKKRKILKRILSECKIKLNKIQKTKNNDLKILKEKALKKLIEYVSNLKRFEIKIKTFKMQQKKLRNLRKQECSRTERKIIDVIFARNTNNQLTKNEYSRALNFFLSTLKIASKKKSIASQNDQRINHELDIVDIQCYLFYLEIFFNNSNYSYNHFKDILSWVTRIEKIMKDYNEDKNSYDSQIFKVRIYNIVYFSFVSIRKIQKIFAAQFENLFALETFNSDCNSKKSYCCNCLTQLLPCIEPKRDVFYYFLRMVQIFNNIFYIYVDLYFSFDELKEFLFADKDKIVRKESKSVLCSYILNRKLIQFFTETNDYIHKVILGSYKITLCSKIKLRAFISNIEKIPKGVLYLYKNSNNENLYALAPNLLNLLQTNVNDLSMLKHNINMQLNEKSKSCPFIVQLDILKLSVYNLQIYKQIIEVAEKNKSLIRTTFK